MKLSVIIPVYNVATYLSRCLESVKKAIEQVQGGVEVICVDDGSNDGSTDILDKYKSEDDRFVVIKQPNSGVAKARQQGLDIATGDYIGWVDGDDYVDLMNFKVLLDAADEKNADMVWCDYFIGDEDHQNRCKSKCADKNNSQELLKSMLKGDVWGVLWARIFSRKFILKNGIEMPPKGCDITEDLSFCALFLAHSPVVVWVDEANYHYVLRCSSAVHSGRLNQLPKIIKNTKWLEGVLNDLVPKSIIELRKKSIKVGMYDNYDYPDEVFFNTFPEVRDVSGVVPIWHRILFRLAVSGSGGRSLSFLILKWIRGVKFRRRS